MAEVATTPQAGVEAEQSVEQRLVSFYTRQGKPQPAPKAEPTPAPAPEPEADAEATTEEPADQAAPENETVEEIEVEDVPEDDAPSPVDEFEIVHNGSQHKLTRAQTIELAQKGFDYTQKTQAVAAKEAQISQALNIAQQVAQTQAALAPEIAQVEGFRSGVAEYKDVNWVQLAQQDASLYAQHRARYDQLRDGLMQAESALNQKFQTVHAGQQQAHKALLEAEYARLPELLPWWGDAKRRETEVAKLTKAAIADGYTADELASVPQARYIKTLWKAAEYDRLTASQGVKLKQMRTAPPMAKPGAANPAPNQATQKMQLARADLKKSGSPQAFAALIAMQEKARRK